MYKRVLNNFFITSRKTGVLTNSFKNNTVLFLKIDEGNSCSLGWGKIQYRFYKSLSKPSSKAIINNLIEKLEEKPELEVADEITSIILSKDDEAAQKKIDEFLQDPKNEKKYKTLELELDWWRQEGRRVPNHIRPHQMLQLLNYRGNKKRKYLDFLFVTEKKQEASQKKKLIIQEEYQKYKANKELKKMEEQEDDDKIEYSLSKNSLFVRIYAKTINQLYNNNVMKAMMFGNSIIFDCSYDGYMSNEEVTSCAKQLNHAISSNRIHDRPFNIHLCNAHKNSKLMLKLKKFIPTIYEDDYPINISDESYLKLFDKSQLCYLTPHCQTEIVKYDPNTIYIIGAFVDKSLKEPISLAKAKREGIRMAKFPLDLFLDWGTGSSKNLTLNNSLNIMLDIQAEKNWNKAMTHVPTRKLQSTREYVRKHNLLAKSKKNQNHFNMDFSNDENSKTNSNNNHIIKDINEHNNSINKDSEKQEDTYTGTWQIDLQKKVLKEEALKKNEALRFKYMAKKKHHLYKENLDTDENSVK